MSLLFDTYRQYPFVPTFEWLSTPEKAADKINSYHEDYPRYVDITTEAVQILMVDAIPNDTRLQWLHNVIFDSSKPSNFRCLNVSVGEPNKRNIAPHYELIPKLMSELYTHYSQKELTLDVLKDWYTDFETVHPFVDGNGRVGGIYVALISHHLYPEKGYWTACQ